MPAKFLLYECCMLQQIQHQKSLIRKGGVTVPKVAVLSQLCKSCGLCVNVCPRKILAIGDKPNAKGYYYMVATEPDKCISCKLCVTVCPDMAIELYKE